MYFSMTLSKPEKMVKKLRSWNEFNSNSSRTQNKSWKRSRKPTWRSISVKRLRLSPNTTLRISSGTVLQVLSTGLHFKMFPLSTSPMTMAQTLTKEEIKVRNTPSRTSRISLTTFITPIGSFVKSKS